MFFLASLAIVLPITEDNKWQNDGLKSFRHLISDGDVITEDNELMSSALAVSITLVVESALASPVMSSAAIKYVGVIKSLIQRKYVKLLSKQVYMPNKWKSSCFCVKECPEVCMLV